MKFKIPKILQFINFDIISFSNSETETGKAEQDMCCWGQNDSGWGQNGGSSGDGNINVNTGIGNSGTGNNNAGSSWGNSAPNMYG